MCYSLTPNASVTKAIYYLLSQINIATIVDVVSKTSRSLSNQATSGEAERIFILPADRAVGTYYWRVPLSVRSASGIFTIGVAGLRCCSKKYSHALQHQYRPRGR